MGKPFASLQKLGDNFYSLDTKENHPNSWKKVEIGNKNFVYVTVLNPENERRYEDLYFVVSSTPPKLLLYHINEEREIMELDRTLKKSIDDKIEMNELILEGLTDFIKTEAEHITRKICMNMQRELQKLSKRRS